MEFDLALFFEAPTEENAVGFVRAVFRLAQRTGIVIDKTAPSASLTGTCRSEGRVLNIDLLKDTGLLE